MDGKIVRIISNLYTVKVKDKLYDCRARGNFRIKNITPLVGDNVKVDVDKKLIIDILERKNILTRPQVANVDCALIIASVKNPILDLNLLDKLITVVTYNKIEPVIIFTKLDLLDDLDNISRLKDYYNNIGIKTFYNTEKRKILDYLQNKQVVLAGQSGAGKSTLINNMINQEIVKTDEISKALGRGKHTTRHTELYQIENVLIADTPGFSSLDLTTIKKEELKNCFKEFNNYQCRFKDCLHNKEIDCKVKEAVLNKEIEKSRYDNYIKILEGIKWRLEYLL